MALAMLAELTDGNSRQQVLDLLDVPDLETLRTRATALWQSHYMNDGATTCILASSLWLNQDVTFVQSTLDTLSKTYYASSIAISCIAAPKALTPAEASSFSPVTGSMRNITLSLFCTYKAWFGTL